MSKKRTFLQVEYELFKLIGKYKKDDKEIGIDHLDCLIIARVNDFQKNDMPCYLTNEQLANIFNVSPRTIVRRIHNLCEIKILESDVTLRSDAGQASRIRNLKVNYPQIAICRTTFNLD